LSEMLAATGEGRRAAVYRREFLRHHGIGDVIGVHFRVTCGTKTKHLA
jgi:hypothetical protein